MRARLAVGLLPLLAVAGCGGGEPPPMGKDADFQDVAWVVAEGSIRPTATFTDGKVSGVGGCNRYSAAYTATGDKLTIHAIVATRMACRPPADEVEHLYFVALGKVARQGVEDGRLVLRDEAGAAVLRYVEASPPRGRFTVTSVNTGDAVASTIEGTEVTADFAADGNLSGSGGCNAYSTTYEVDGNEMTIKPAAATRKACPEPDGVMEQEADYFAALDTVASYELAGDRLTLLREDGTIAATLARD